MSKRSKIADITSSKSSNGQSIPRTISEALFSVVWPFVDKRIKPLLQTRLGYVIITICILAAILLAVPDFRVSFLKEIDARIARLIHPPPALVVVVPNNLDSLPASVAGLKDQVREKLSTRGAFQIIDSESTHPVAQSILSFEMKQEPNGINASAKLQTERSGIVAFRATFVPSDLIEVVGPHLGQALLDGLAINWNTLEPLNLSNVCKPIAKALLIAAEQIEEVQRKNAIAIMKRAIDLDNRCATAFWYLGQLLEANGETNEASEMEKVANSIDLEHPRINTRIKPTESLARSIAAGTWKELTTGMSTLKVTQAEYKIDFYVWRLDPRHFRLRIVNQESEFGHDASWFRLHSGAIFAVNAGRFKLDPGHRLSAAGLVVVNGIKLSDAWPEIRGGVLAIWDDDIRIIPATANGYGRLSAPFAVQATPVMIEPGGKWSMVTNDYDRQARVAVCLLPNNLVAIVVVTGYGLSLWEFATLLHRGNPGQKLNCDSAIALDGGPSTQVSWDGSDKLELRGGWPVHDALVVLPR